MSNTVQKPVNPAGAPAMFRASGAPLPGIPAQPSSVENEQPTSRTFTYPLVGGGSLTATCPSWCTADHSTDVTDGIHPEDLFHEGDEIAIEFTTAEGSTDRLLAARIAQYPFAHGDDSERPHMALMPYADSGEALGYQTAAEVHETINRLQNHLYDLRKLAERLAEARAEAHEARQESRLALGRAPGGAWMSLDPDDVMTMPVSYLMKVFGAEIVEVEPDEVGLDGELSSTGPEDVVIVLPRILTQILREAAVRRLLLGHLRSHRSWKLAGE